MRIIFQEFIECYREVSKFSNSNLHSDYIAPKYLTFLNELILENNISANPIELAKIDIAYCMVFFGLGVEGEAVLKKLFRKKYNPSYYHKLIYFIKMKPKQSNVERSAKWKVARDMELKELHQLVNELYKNKNHPDKTTTLSPLAIEFQMNLPYEKYYGGHQFRLGHYFRHLYQSFKYLENDPFLDDKRRYSYGKMFRAQLSTYEQALLFFNSISKMGMKWEYTPELLEVGNSPSRIITKYNLIKNLPGEHLFGIHYKKYYPNVDYETDEHNY
jgi:hypothetical protein